MTAKMYVTGIPKGIPKGRILVHNSIRPKNFDPTTEPGMEGFKAWLEEHDIHHVRCDCGWAPQSRGSLPRARRWLVRTIRRSPRMTADEARSLEGIWIKYDT